MRKTFRSFLFNASLLITASFTWSNEVPSATELLIKVDKLYHQDNAYAKLTMEIQTPDYQRTMSMESWSIGLDYSLMRVLTPKKEQGVATLKRENEMWNYLPKIRKTIKVPPSMMMGSWMGSDFTNDDLMREGSWVEEFEVDLKAENGQYILDLVSKENTVTVWGAMQIVIDQETLLPIKQIYLDEDGSAVREMVFSDIKTFDGVTLPSVMTLTPLTKEGHLTRVTYDELSFNVEIDSDFFTLQNLQRRR
ncbi:outer membrane lipoprotein-sorting protein [Reinekea forsetii]|nr:outer membrane lipoprotein-sorting protein [Reinekea forsetii]